MNLQLNGGGSTRTTELMPVIRLEFKERWIKPKLDLRELVTLREQGWTLREIATKAGVGRTTILRKLRRVQSA